MHVVDEETSKFVVSRQRVSEQLSPRDGVRPPLQELVDAFVTLYMERTGDDHDRIRREITELYRAAGQTAEEVRARRRDVAEAAGLRHPTPAELQAQRDKARVELDKAEAGRRQMQARHDEIVATIARTNENQAQQIEALHAQLVELRQLLRSQDADMARLREQLEETSRRAGRARAEVDRAQAEVAGARSDPDQGDIDLAFIVGQVMPPAASEHRTPLMSDAAEGVRQDRDAYRPLAAPTEVRTTPGTPADRESWKRERRDHGKGFVAPVSVLSMVLGGQVMATGYPAAGWIVLGIVLFLIGFYGFYRWLRSDRSLPADLREHSIDSRWQVVSGPRPDRSGDDFIWNSPDRVTPIVLNFEVPPRHDERPVFVRGRLRMETRTELLHGRSVSVRWTLLEGSRNVDNGSLHLPVWPNHANLNGVELPPSESPGPYTLKLQRTDNDCADISVMWYNHGVLARRWHQWHRVSMPERSEATDRAHDYQQQMPKPSESLASERGAVGGTEAPL